MTLTVILVILVLFQSILVGLSRWQVRTLMRLHRHDLAATRKTWLEFGRTEGRMSLPIVQHCNSKTNYEFIKHQWDPENCTHCKEVQDILNER